MLPHNARADCGGRVPVGGSSACWQGLLVVSVTLDQDQRFDAIDAEFVSLATDINKLFRELEEREDEAHRGIGQRLERLDNRMESLTDGMGRLLVHNGLEPIR